MSNNNNDGDGCLSLIIDCIVAFVVVTLICSYCTRRDKNQPFLDHVIEDVHIVKNHVDSVWNQESVDTLKQ